jgi:hypothetical protein
MSTYSELALCNYNYILYIHIRASQICSNKKKFNLFHVRETKFPFPHPHPLPPDGSELLIPLLDNTGATCTFNLEQKRINF